MISMKQTTDTNRYLLFFEENALLLPDSYVQYIQYVQYVQYVQYAI